MIVADRLGTGRTASAVHQKYNKIRGKHPLTQELGLVGPAGSQGPMIKPSAGSAQQQPAPQVGTVQQRSQQPAIAAPSPAPVGQWVQPSPNGTAQMGEQQAGAPVVLLKPAPPVLLAPPPQRRPRHWETQASRDGIMVPGSGQIPPTQAVAHHPTSAAPAPGVAAKGNEWLKMQLHAVQQQQQQQQDDSGDVVDWLSPGGAQQPAAMLLAPSTHQQQTVRDLADVRHDTVLPGER